MWHTTHSTGLEQLNEDHVRIEEVIKNLSHATNQREEKSLLMDLYCIIIRKMNAKTELMGLDLSPGEQTRDNAFLHDIRVKIWERDNAHITQLKLIRDLRQILEDHVLHNNQARGSHHQNS